MERALIKRSHSIADLPSDFKLSIPDILQSDLVFENSKYLTGDGEENEENNVKSTHSGTKKIRIISTLMSIKFISISIKQFVG